MCCQHLVTIIIYNNFVANIWLGHENRADNYSGKGLGDSVVSDHQFGLDDYTDSSLLSKVDVTLVKCGGGQLPREQGPCPAQYLTLTREHS